MANPVVFKDADIYWGGYDVGGEHNEVGLAASWSENQDERFGDVGKAFYPGVQEVTITAKGFWAAAATTGLDQIAAASRAATVPWPFTVCPIGDSDGYPCYTVQSRQFRMDWGGAHGVSMPFSITHKPSRAQYGADLIRQTVLLPKALRTTTTSGTANALGLLAVGYRLCAVLHVFAVNGGSWVVTIESDTAANFPSPTTRATFTAATGLTRQYLEVAGPVATDTYWRAVLTQTGGTSCTAFCAVGFVKA